MAKHEFKSKKDKSSMSNLALLAVGLLSFVLTVGASATGTYAWFTLNNFATVSFAEFKINEHSDFQIGMKNGDGDIDYFDDITDEDLAEYNVGYKPGADMADTSSMFQDMWLNENTDYEHDSPVLRTSYTGSNHRESYRANSGYLQFEFYFLANQDMYLFLADDETTVEPLHQNNVEYAEALNDSGASTTIDELDNVVNAVRISLFSSDGFYIYEPGYVEGQTTSLGGILDTNPIDDYFDHEDGHEIVYGEYENDDKIIYDDPLTEDVDYTGRGSCFNAKHAEGVRPFNLEKSVENGLEIKQETTYPLDKLSIGKNEGQFDPSVKTPIAKLHANVPHRLVATIYLEGWDLDVTQYICAAKFSVKLGFRGLAAPLDD